MSEAHERLFLLRRPLEVRESCVSGASNLLIFLLYWSEAHERLFLLSQALEVRESCVSGASNFLTPTITN